MTQKHFAIGFIGLIVLVGVVLFFTYKPEPATNIPGAPEPSPSPSLSPDIDLSRNKPQNNGLTPPVQQSQLQQQPGQAAPAQPQGPGTTQGSVASRNGKYKSAPPMTIDATKTYTAVISTNKGTMTAELYAKDVPKTVNNFVFLANDHFYDGVIFHRIIKGFMEQTGDPTGTGTGGPGYKFEDEPITRSYTKGTLAMANAGPNTNGSQFFIMNADYSLPKNYTIFGKVTEGMETVDAIGNTPTAMSAGGEQSKPTEPVIINSITIQE